jgi:predicted dehydrogenase
MTKSARSAKGLRVAVIGLGRMGMRHVQAVQSMSMDVCGLVDISEKALEGARATKGLEGSAVSTDAVRLMRDVRPEAVVISTTAPSHGPLVAAAVSAGAKFILCEKPMATSLAAVDEIVDACRKAGVTIAVNHQMRFMSIYSTIKALIGTAEIGPLATMVVAGSNMGLAMNVSHYFETLRYMSGSRVREVRAWLEKDRIANPRGPEFEDSSGRLLATTESGHTMYVDFSVAAGHGLQTTYVCRNAQITVDELSGDVRISARRAEFRELPTARYGNPADVRTVVVEPASTVEPTVRVWSAMLAGEDWPDAEIGRQTVACLVAAHASNEAGGIAVRTDDPALKRDRVFPWA